MVKRKVPFVANSDDDMHCVPAVFRMLHQHYFGTDLSWQEIDRILKVTPGKGVWTFAGQLAFARKGLEILNVEPIDFGELLDQGMEYLRQVVGKETADYYIERSNLSDVLDQIPMYLKHVKHEVRQVEQEEIKRHLSQGKLITAEVNSSILNNQEGFNLHMVLIYDWQDGEFILHDPGLPPRPGRKVSEEKFEKAFAFDGASRAMSVFSKKKEKNG